ncbi:MAG: DUF5703 domain-containing protein [Candidatus Hydrogenedens sp.]
MRKIFLLTLLFVCSSLFCQAQPANYPDCYDEVWDTPGQNSSDSMPIGNGDIGANVWTEENGDIVALISKTDAWDDNGQLLKLARVRFKITPSLTGTNANFSQRLHLQHGTIKIQGNAGKTMAIFRVDANMPVAVLNVESKENVDLQVILEVWRTTPRNYTEDEVNQSSLIQKIEEGVVYPDVVLDNPPFSGLLVYHQNNHSIWGYSMDLQGFAEYKNKFTDPLLNRIFGCAIWSNDLKKADTFTLEGKGKKNYTVYILGKTLHPSTPDEWLNTVVKEREKVLNVVEDKAFEQHKNWWRNFWQRSWIVASGDKDAEWISKVYALQRWVTACGSRGAYPVKFNGSIFTVEWREGNELKSDPDYRRWGGGYWWQNTRLPYWPLLSSGDFDLMKPVFDLYMSIMEISKLRSKVYWGCEGIYMPETIYPWGLLRNRDYGFDRTGLKVGEITNPYIRWIWASGLELTLMMLDYYDFTKDDVFLKETLLPYAREIIRFFETRFPKNETGMLIIHPAQAVETYQEGVTDDTPTVSGLHAVLPRLMALNTTEITNEEKSRWEQLLKSVVPVPIKDGRIQPARIFNSKRGNVENPELYAVFPYRIFATGKPNIDIAIESFQKRYAKDYHGWQQDAIQASFLGLTDETKKMLITNAYRKHEGSRFPAFWGPNYDWIPDQCHGGNIMSTLQFMLLQWDKDNIYLFPAWDKNWNVDFKLYAPYNTSIRCILQKGQIQIIDVTPQERKNNITMYLQ